MPFTNLGEALRAAGSSDEIGLVMAGAAAMLKDVRGNEQRAIARAKVDPVFMRLWSKRMGTTH